MFPSSLLLPSISLNDSAVNGGKKGLNTMLDDVRSESKLQLGLEKPKKMPFSGIA